MRDESGKQISESIPINQAFMDRTRLHRERRPTCRRRPSARGPSVRTPFGPVWLRTVDDGGGRASRRGTCFKPPLSSSISSAWRPTIRSRAAILASYSCSRSASCTLSSSAPASNLPTQIRINCRKTSCRFDSPFNRKCGRRCWAIRRPNAPKAMMPRIGRNA